jgi:hypothetical protein
MIDHLVYGVPDLAQAVDGIARQTGVRPRVGGQHPGRGTHNALLALGPRQYLEIIALDPAQPNTANLAFPELRHLAAPALIGWASAVANIDAARDRVLAAGLQAVGPLDGARATADGRMLSWKTLRIADPPLSLLPFFIAWDDTTVHPSADSPSGCTLLAFELAHPDPDAVRRLLAELGVTATVAKGSRAQLTARLQTPNGTLLLT